ncbi:hypothetical protein CVU76_01065 [Candidatus Dojkabacteria bacterium HGW-Dojkabacteria-1]|uniref:Transglutaminase-like domain-containing protein n=1 Tax=Candidatus Dojkabacteria bacterium HGW-Dojkabacteria-1 TaxID=2013761 RepID=A0A2N2F345_9BACT|nr:MAG: hypothetical protein CVU76_01065 [Candidatus Dojkabacteria bacterium HGW-Dojkabacteria-1]
MFRKLVVYVLVVAMLAACSTPPSGVNTQPVAQPVAIPDSSNQPLAQASAEATIVPAGGSITTSEGKVITTPTPVRIQTPPTLQEDVDGLQVYYLYKPINWQEAGIAVMPIGAAVGVMDSPAPGPADVLALIVWGTLTVGYVVYTANVPVGAIYYDNPMDLSAALALWASVLGYIPVSPEHKEAHTVVAGSSNVATQVFADLKNRWPPDPNEQDPIKKVVCYALKSGNQVLRYLVWAGTNYSATGIPRGNLSWWQFGPSGPEAYGYGGKSFETMRNVPKDLAGKGYTIDPVGCDSFTPPFQLLAP